MKKNLSGRLVLLLLLAIVLCTCKRESKPVTHTLKSSETAPNVKNLIAGTGKLKTLSGDQPCTYSILYDWQLTYTSYSSSPDDATVRDRFMYYMITAITGAGRTFVPTTDNLYIYYTGEDMRNVVQAMVHDALADAAISLHLDSWQINYSTAVPGDNCGGTYNSPGTGSSEPSDNTSFTQDITKVNLPPCFTNVLDALENLNNNCIANVITNFSGNTPGYIWQVTGGGSDPNVNGTTTVSYPNNVLTMTTTFYTDNFTNGSDIGIARNVIHEGLHAYLTAYFKNDPVNAYKTYPEMVDEWNSQKHPDLNDIQHDQFVFSFIGDIANLLQAYGQSKGLNIDYQYYSDLAWGGLQDTHAFKSLSYSDRYRILNVILTEQSGEDQNGNPTTKKGNPSGC